MAASATAAPALFSARVTPTSVRSRAPARRNAICGVGAGVRGLTVRAAATKEEKEAAEKANAPPYQVAQRKELYELRIYGAYYVCMAPYENREQGLGSLMVRRCRLTLSNPR